MYLFELEFCLDICPGVGLLDRMVILFLVFWGTSILFSTVAAPTCIPTNSVGGFFYAFIHFNVSLALKEKPTYWVPALCYLAIQNDFSEQSLSLPWYLSDNPLISARAALNQSVIIVTTHSKRHTLTQKQTLQPVKKKLEFGEPVDPQQALRNRQTGHAKRHWAKFRFEVSCFHLRGYQESSEGKFK